MSKEKQKRADGFEQIEEATISTEQFIEKNQKLLVRGVLVIIIVVGAILGYYRFYKAPMEQEALKQRRSALRMKTSAGRSFLCWNQCALRL